MIALRHARCRARAAGPTGRLAGRRVEVDATAGALDEQLTIFAARAKSQGRIATVELWAGWSDCGDSSPSCEAAVGRHVASQRAAAPPAAPEASAARSAGHREPYGLVGFPHRARP